MNSSQLLKCEPSGALPGAPVFSSLFTSKDHAQQVCEILHKAWWAAYETRTEAERIITSALRKARHEAIMLFGKRNEKYPDCEQCLHGSLFGGPRHEASSMCESGKHPHCSCDCCF